VRFSANVNRNDGAGGGKTGSSAGREPHSTSKLLKTTLRTIKQPRRNRFFRPKKSIKIVSHDMGLTVSIVLIF